MTETAGSGPTKHMLALLAALSELDEADRVRYMRAYLEYVIDLALANEEEYFNFLTECALIAANNVQDIRIENLELQFEALVNPPPKPWGEVFLEVAMALALQAGIIIAWELAAAGFISILAWAAVRKNTLSAAMKAMAARGPQNESESKLWYWMEERSRLRTLQNSRLQVYNKRGAWFVNSPGPEFPLNPKYVSGMSKPSYSGATEVIVNKQYLQEVEQEILLLQHMVDQNKMDVERALATYESALSDSQTAVKKSKDGWGEKWRETIGGAWGGVITGTTTTALEGAAAAIGGSSQTGASTNSEPFLSSEVISRYLDWISNERMQMAESYATMRMMLRATSDKNLLAGDEFLKLLLLLGTDQLQGWRDLRVYRAAARPAIAKGMEAAIWYEYLNVNGILLPPEKVSWRNSVPRKAHEVVGAYVLLSDGKETPRTLDDPYPYQRPRRDGTAVYGEMPPMYAHDAMFYKYADKIPQLLVAALFHRFAQPYYAAPENAVKLLPFPYDPAAYANISVPPQEDFWGLPDPIALRRIDEMRYVVIRYFGDVIGLSAGATPTIRNLIPEGTDPAFVATIEALGFTAEKTNENLDYWLSGQMECADDEDEQTLADAGMAATAAAEQQFKQLGDLMDATSSDPLTLYVEEALFANALTDLNQDIQAYLLKKSGVLERGNTADHRTIEDLADEIATEQSMLDVAYQALIEHARAEDQEQAYVDRYRSGVEAVKSWSPGQDWTWYGPSESVPR